MAGTDALAGSAPGSAGAIESYTPAQYASDIYNIGQAESFSSVLMAKGSTQYGYLKQPGAAVGGFAGSVPNRFSGNITKTGGTQDDIRTLRSALNWVHTLDPGQTQQFTTALYAAGFYPDGDYGKNPNAPAAGGQIFDDHAQYAARALFDEVVKYNLANPQNPKSMQEILQDRIAKQTGQSKIDDATKSGPGTAYEVTVDDPATLRAQVVRTGQAILGRALNDNETDALVAKMTQAEKAPQMAKVEAGQQAQTGGDVVLQQARVDAEARMAEQMKSQNPDEAGAYAQLNYSTMLMNMLGGGQVSAGQAAQ